MDKTLRDDLIWNRAKGKCQICLFGITPALHLHHIQPKHKGGSDRYSNLVAICPNCHAMVHLCSKWTFEVGGVPFPRLENEQQIALLTTYGYSEWSAEMILLVATQHARASGSTADIYPLTNPDENKARGYGAATEFLRRLSNVY